MLTSEKYVIDCCSRVQIEEFHCFIYQFQHFSKAIKSCSQIWIFL